MRNVEVGWNKPHIQFKRPYGWRWVANGSAWVVRPVTGLKELNNFIEHMDRTWRKQ